jgi:hypothetical protein
MRASITQRTARFLSGRIAVLVPRELPLPPSVLLVKKNVEEFGVFFAVDAFFEISMHGCAFRLQRTLPSEKHLADCI